MIAYDHVILGCGVGGLCTAGLLLQAGATNILVLDEFDQPGGNQISCEENGFTFDVGAFYYWPTMPLFRMYPSLLEDCRRRSLLVERIRPSGVVGRYPFGLKAEFIDRGPSYWTMALGSMGLARLRRRRILTAKDYATYWMGQKLFDDLGMADYIHRFFGVPADQIEAQFAIRRMDLIPRYGKPSYWLRNVYRHLKERVRSNSRGAGDPLLVRPEKGLAYMYAKAVHELVSRGVAIRLGTPIDRIAKQGSHFEISAAGAAFRTSNLVNTTPLCSIAAHFGIADASGLETVDLATLFVSFEGERGFDAQILYNWGRKGRWKRLTMHSDYYGARNGREYASVEVTLFRSGPPDFAELFNDFVSSVNGYGLFTGSLRLEGSRVTPAAYPAYTIGSTQKSNRVIERLGELGVQTVGRQGRFDYLPTGEHVAQQVDRTLRR